jgi:hypothetical protein
MTKQHHLLSKACDAGNDTCMGFDIIMKIKKINANLNEVLSSISQNMIKVNRYFSMGVMT